MCLLRFHVPVRSGSFALEGVRNVNVVIDRCVCLLVCVGGGGVDSLRNTGGHALVTFVVCHRERQSWAPVDRRYSSFSLALVRPFWKGVNFPTDISPMGFPGHIACLRVTVCVRTSH